MKCRGPRRDGGNTRSGKGNEIGEIGRDSIRDGLKCCTERKKKKKATESSKDLG